MRVVCGSQRTAEWMDSRRGMITASRIKDVLNFTQKKVEGAQRRKYRKDLAMERLTGITATHYVTPAMMDGVEREPIARSVYELERKVMVESVGFVLHSALDYSGASPDGITENKAIEIKCPTEGVFTDWVLTPEVVPDEHQDQCLWVMECCGLEFLDFVGYHPRMRPLIIPMHRNESRIAEITEAVIQFQAEVEATIDRLRPWVIPVTREELDHAPDISQWGAAFDSYIGDLVP